MGRDVAHKGHSMNISWTILIIVVLTAISCAVPGMFLVLRGVALLS